MERSQYRIKNLPQNDEKFSTKAARFGKKVSIITLPIGLAVGAAGVVTANPALAAGGFTSAGVDTVQIIGFSAYEKRSKRKEQEKNLQKGRENVLFMERKLQHSKAA